METGPSMESENAANEATTTTTPVDGEDLTPDKDGGVVKKILREGSGTETPNKGDTVYVHYVGCLLDGTKFDSSRDRNEQFSFNLGSGMVIKAWDIGVASMKKGELARLTCKPEYAYGESGSGPTIGPNATLVFEVELFQWEGEDVSEKKDGGVRRRVISAGQGYRTPDEGATVQVHLKGTYNNAVFDDREVSFVIGEGEDQDICPGIEQALKKFKNNEHSELSIKSVYAFGDEGSQKFNIPANADVTYEVKLNNFEKPKEAWEMEPLEKLNQSEIIKQKGTDYFKAGKYKQAINYYSRVLTYLEHETTVEGEEEARRHSLVLAAHLNVAMCHLKQNNYNDAEAACDKALALDPQNEKGWFRRGMAKSSRNDYEAAIADFQEVLKVDPNNKSARKELQVAKNKLKQFREKEKKLYANMFEKMAASEPKTSTDEKKNGSAGEGMDTSGEDGSPTDPDPVPVSVDASSTNGSGDTSQ